MKIHSILLLGVGAIAMTSIAIPQAEAIPAYARKYGKSCQTCHVAFPKLTPFGEAFRRNGYRFPAGEDADASEDEPVALGHEAHKKVFPDTVWPGELPGAIPLAVQVASVARFESEGPEKVDFAGLGSRLGINLSSTLGSSLSVWAGAAIAAEGDEAELEIERIFVVVSPFDEPVANLRLGRFEPGVSILTSHRNLGLSPWIVSSPTGNSPFAIDPAHPGIEVTGLVAGRLDYAAGLSEGTGALTNRNKDVYGRVGYKLGGMRPDGIGGATETDPWRETSLQVGAFGYYGRAVVGDELAMQTDEFWIAGGDASFIWRDLNLLAAVARRRHERPMLADPTQPIREWHFALQSDYVVFPWLIPTARYELARIEGESSSRFSGGVYALVRANFRLFGLASVEAEGHHFDAGQGLFGVHTAF